MDKVDTPQQNSDHGIVFIDTKPSEQIHVVEDDFLCFAGLTPSVTPGLARLKSYKATKGSKKAKEARRITAGLSDSSLKFSAFACVGRMTGALIEWAIASLNQSRKDLGARWEEIEAMDDPVLYWQGAQFNFPLAAGLSVYANMLAVIALWFGTKAANQGNIRHIKLALDNLPNDSVKGMEFMKKLTFANADISQMWRSNLECGVTFELGNLRSFIAQDGKRKPAKYNPHAILVDWFAASCIARFNPDQISQESNLSSDDIDEIAAISTVAEDLGAAKVVNLEDTALMAQVKRHWRETNSETE